LKTQIKALLAVTMLPFLACFAGCKSHHVQVTVENRTRMTLRLLEVDYPNASFGMDTVGPGSVLKYSIQVQGSGPVKVMYTAPDKHQAQIDGPALHEKQEGNLDIVLQPADKADFHLQ
jgi:hypothetical protein